MKFILWHLCRNLSKTLEELIVVFSTLIFENMFLVSRLKAVCERVICDNLDVSNAAQALVLAHLHEAKQLKKVALDFVTQNIVKVSESPGWTQIVGGNEVLGDILKSVMIKLKQ